MDVVVVVYIGYVMFGVKKLNIVGIFFGLVLIGIILNGFIMMNVFYYV